MMKIGEAPDVPLRPAYWRYWLLFIPWCYVEYKIKKLVAWFKPNAKTNQYGRGMMDEEIERLARLAYNAASTLVPLDQVSDDGWWNEFSEGEKEEWRRAV